MAFGFASNALKCSEASIQKKEARTYLEWRSTVFEYEINAYRLYSDSYCDQGDVIITFILIKYK